MKKILILLLVPFLLLCLTGCGKNELILEDAKLGFKTTFTYSGKDTYTDIEYDDEGASRELTFESKDLDAEFEMYYNTITDTSYKLSQDIRKNQKYYKEYTFNGYKAYSYSEYPDNIKLNIILNENDNKMYDVLFVSIDRADNNKNVIMQDVLDQKEVQNLFNSMKFEKVDK